MQRAVFTAFKQKTAANGYKRQILKKWGECGVKKKKKKVLRMVEVKSGSTDCCNTGYCQETVLCHPPFQQHVPKLFFTLVLVVGLAYFN